MTEWQESLVNAPESELFRLNTLYNNRYLCAENAGDRRRYLQYREDTERELLRRFPLDN